MSFTGISQFTEIIILRLVNLLVAFLAAPLTQMKLWVHSNPCWKHGYIYIHATDLEIWQSTAKTDRLFSFTSISENTCNISIPRRRFYKLSTAVRGGRMKHSGHTLKQGRSVLDTGRNFFTVRRVKPRNELPKARVRSPSSKAFKTSPDKALRHLVWPRSRPCSEQDVGVETLQDLHHLTILFESLTFITVKRSAALLKKGDLPSSDPLPPSGASWPSRWLACHVSTCHDTFTHLRSSASAQRRGAVTRLSRTRGRGQFDRHLTRALPCPNRLYRPPHPTQHRAVRSPGACPVPTSSGPRRQRRAPTDGRPGVRPLSQQQPRCRPAPRARPTAASRSQAALPGATTLPVMARRHFRPALPRLPAVRHTSAAAGSASGEPMSSSRAVRRADRIDPAGYPPPRRVPSGRRRQPRGRGLPLGQPTEGRPGPAALPR